MEYFPEQSEVTIDAVRNGVMERIRNFGDGALAKVAIAATFASGTVATEMAVNPEPVAADIAPTTQLTPDEQQQCIDAALTEPEVLSSPAMYHAGNRPFGHPASQVAKADLWYEGLPDQCGPAGFVRTSTGRFQMHKDGHWVSLPDGPGHWGNESGKSTTLYFPPHVFPNYVFNDPVPTKNGYHFHKMRILIDNKLKDKSDHSIVAEKKYTVPMQVHGNTRQAIQSKLKAQRLRAKGLI